MLGVGVMTTIIGVGTAWIVTMCRFPGRAFFDWALLVPLAVPTYIVAYAYVDILNYTGPVQDAIRALFGFHTSRDYWFPEIRSLPGAVFVMELVLYPYVYLTARATFLMQSACVLDVSRTLGAGPLRLFFRVALPMARPAIAVGVSLALMECLNDIGAVEFFGVKTLIFSVYDTWLNRGSLAGAVQIACAMLVVVFALLWVEQHGRRHQRFHPTAGRYHALPGYKLSRGWSAVAIAAYALPVLLGFVTPALLLADFASRRLEDLTAPAFQSAATNSLVLAAIAAVITVGLGVLLTYAQRMRASRLLQKARRGWRRSAMRYRARSSRWVSWFRLPPSTISSTSSPAKHSVSPRGSCSPGPALASSMPIPPVFSPPSTARSKLALPRFRRIWTWLRARSDAPR